jgi:hypothetical protein
MKKRVFLWTAMSLACALTVAPAFAETAVKLTVGDRVLTATFEDNATARALMSRFPLSLPMMDLYGREMCYRFPEPLPAENAGPSGYQVGDIAYWPPRHSFVIFYRQNGEIIDGLQRVGRMTSGTEVFQQTGDTQVKFEVYSD